MATLLFFLNIVQEAILIKDLKSKFSKRYKIVNFTILIIAAHLTFQKLEQRNYLVSYFLFDVIDTLLWNSEAVKLAVFYSYMHDDS